MYLSTCICVCVFACLTPGNIVIGVLVTRAFQKYTTCCLVYNVFLNFGRESRLVGGWGGAYTYCKPCPNWGLVQLGLVQLGLVRMTLVQLGLVQMGVDRYLGCLRLNNQIYLLLKYLVCNNLTSTILLPLPWLDLLPVAGLFYWMNSYIMDFSFCRP